jgi:phosphopantothenoylcysteine synthetase/decarboxylase
MRSKANKLADERVRRHISLSRGAQALITYPARTSDIEKHRRPLPILTDQYKKWLEAA